MSRSSRSLGAMIKPHCRRTDTSASSPKLRAGRGDAHVRFFGRGMGNHQPLLRALDNLGGDDIQPVSGACDDAWFDPLVVWRVAMDAPRAPYLSATRAAAPSRLPSRLRWWLPTDLGDLGSPRRRPIGVGPAADPARLPARTARGTFQGCAGSAGRAGSRRTGRPPARR